MSEFHPELPVILKLILRTSLQLYSEVSVNTLNTVVVYIKHKFITTNQLQEVRRDKKSLMTSRGDPAVCV